MSESLDKASQTIGVIKQIADIAGESPEMRQTGKELATAALTVSRAIKNALLPLAAVNYGIKKARDYFEKKFAADLEPFAANIPAESIVEPKASVAGPAIQGLAYTHEEPSLRDLFLKLLATAMDGRVAKRAHPSFVEIIKQLDADEAEILRVIYKGYTCPIVEISIITLDTGKNPPNLFPGTRTIRRHVMDWHDTTDNSPVVEPARSASIDNWVRLGLIDVNYGRAIVGPGVYDWVTRRPEYLEAKALTKEGETSVHYDAGMLTFTDFGKLFATAVGLGEETRSPVI